MNIGLMYDAIDVIETLCDCIRDTPASCDACGVWIWNIWCGYIRKNR